MFCLGACGTTEQPRSKPVRAKSMIEDRHRELENTEIFNRHRRTSLASGPLPNGYFPHNLKQAPHSTSSKLSQKPRPSGGALGENLWRRQTSLDKGESSESREGGKFSKMGSTYNPKHERKR